MAIEQMELLNLTFPKKELKPILALMQDNEHFAPILANKVMNNLWIAESGKGKWLTNNKSSASGHFHWTNATWKDFQKANPNDTAGMTKASLNDYDTASKFQLMKLKSDALRYQKATGKPATEQALYAIHYGGFGGRNTPGAINYSNMLSAPDFAKSRGY
jgi:hypothetical protein